MISNKWSKVAQSWLGDKNGKHCHWCKFMKSEEGEVTCENPKSKFNDGERIRTWDGLACAKECGVFELDKHYTTDKTFNEYFKSTNKKER